MGNIDGSGVAIVAGSGVEVTAGWTGSKDGKGVGTEVGAGVEEVPLHVEHEEPEEEVVKVPSDDELQAPARVQDVKRK